MADSMIAQVEQALSDEALQARQHPRTRQPMRADSVWYLSRDVALDILRPILDAAEREIAEQAGELARIDEAFSRRPALADLPDRFSKAHRACAIAGQADDAQRKLAAANARAQQAEQERDEFKTAAIALRVTLDQAEREVERLRDAIQVELDAMAARGINTANDRLAAAMVKS